MLVAMVDVMTGVGALAPVVWAAALAGLSLWPAAALRRGRSIRGAALWHADALDAAMAVHRSGSLLLMAALVLLAGAAGSPGLTSAATTNTAHDGHSAAAAPLAAALWVAVAALSIFTVWLIAALSRRSSGARRAGSVASDTPVRLIDLIAPLESASMAVSILMMTIALTS